MKVFPDETSSRAGYITAVLFVMSTIFSFMFSTLINEANAVELNDKTISTRASDATPIEDERIAALFSINKDSGSFKRICTASFLGKDLWLTASHCKPKSGDYLKWGDSKKISIKEVFYKSKKDDLALLRADREVGAKSFDLPDKVPSQGDLLTIVGYGATHDYASVAPVEVQDFIDSYPPEVGIPYENLMTVISTTPARTCEGDSGGPAYVDNKIYAVHTAGATNLQCTDRKDSLSWMTPLNPERVSWIRSFLNSDGAKKGRDASSTGRLLQ